MSRALRPASELRRMAELDAVRHLAERIEGGVTPADLFDVAIEADARPWWLVSLATMLVEYVAREAHRDGEALGAAARHALAALRDLGCETPMTKLNSSERPNTGNNTMKQRYEDHLTHLEKHYSAELEKSDQVDAEKEAREAIETEEELALERGEAVQKADDDALADLTQRYLDNLAGTRGDRAHDLAEAHAERELDADGVNCSWNDWFREYCDVPFPGGW